MNNENYIPISNTYTWKQPFTNGLQNSLLIKLQAEKFPKHHKEIPVPHHRF